MSDIHWIKGTTVVPSITDRVLQERFAKYKPIIFKGGEYYSIKCYDDERFLRGTAFTWMPEIIKQVNFTPLVMVNTNHFCGHISFFKPSVAEVLAQLPDGLPDHCNAFYLDKDLVSCYEDGSGHMAVTTFGIAE